MAIPTIPEQPYRPSLEQTYVDLLESLALEKMALAHILQAEADKMQAFTGPLKNFPTQPTTKEILIFQETTVKLLEAVIYQERLLAQKLSLLKELPLRLSMKEKKRRIHKEELESSLNWESLIFSLESEGEMK
jgi:hypothetical protein